MRECMAWTLGYCCRGANAAGVLIMQAGGKGRGMHRVVAGQGGEGLVEPRLVMHGVRIRKKRDGHLCRRLSLAIGAEQPFARQITGATTRALLLACTSVQLWCFGEA